MAKTDVNKFDAAIERMVDAFRGYSVEQYKNVMAERAERFSLCEHLCLDTLYRAVHVDRGDDGAVLSLYEAWDAKAMQCLEAVNTDREQALWDYADAWVETAMGIAPAALVVAAYKDAAKRLGMSPTGDGPSTL